MNTLRAAAVAATITVLAAPVARAEDAAGLVGIGGGRSLYLECQGEGSPTVFVIPGAGSYTQAWNASIAADDPPGQRHAGGGARHHQRDRPRHRPQPDAVPTAGHC